MAEICEHLSDGKDRKAFAKLTASLTTGSLPFLESRKIWFACSRVHPSLATISCIARISNEKTDFDGLRVRGQHHGNDGGQHTSVVMTSFTLTDRSLTKSGTRYVELRRCAKHSCTEVARLLKPAETTGRGEARLTVITSRHDADQAATKLARIGNRAPGKAESELRMFKGLATCGGSVFETWTECL